MKHRRVFMQSDFIVVGSFFSPGLIATDYTLSVDLMGHARRLAARPYVLRPHQTVFTQSVERRMINARTSHVLRAS